jgi:hypothetical protein
MYYCSCVGSRGTALTRTGGNTRARGFHRPDGVILFFFSINYIRQRCARYRALSRTISSTSSYRGVYRRQYEGCEIFSGVGGGETNHRQNENKKKKNKPPNCCLSIGRNAHETLRAGDFSLYLSPRSISSNAVC